MRPKREGRVDGPAGGDKAASGGDKAASGGGKAASGGPGATSKTASALASKAGSGSGSKAVERVPMLPPRMTARSWWGVFKRTAKEFKADELLDRAAALTYFAVLAMFPALLLVISVLGLVGTGASNAVLDNVQKLAPGSVRDVLHTMITQVRASRGVGGPLALAGFLGAVWSSSGYVGAFIRASNVVYDVHEKRPVWKTTPLRVGLTLLMMVLSLISALIVVFTGPLAQWIADFIGLGHTAVVVWSIVKWPVLVFLVAVMIVLLFWAAPGVHSLSFRWISPGALGAVLLWTALSGGFAAYLANFNSYNKTYGTLAGVIVFLIWLWLSNLAILLGLEFDAELDRERGMELPRAAAD